MPARRSRDNNPRHLHQTNRHRYHQDLRRHSGSCTYQHHPGGRWPRHYAAGWVLLDPRRRYVKRDSTPPSNPFTYISPENTLLLTPQPPAAPNFHKYLQTSPLYSATTALLGSYTTAGQFQVVDGQLVQLVSAPGAATKLLYAVVSETRYINDNSLSVTFSATKNTYGTFAWQGDGLTWSVAGVTRPNSAAWYVCTGQQLYINLGNYLYQTPDGCADQTIHYYNDKTANN